MLRKPAETTPSRPSIPIVRSVPSPTMRTEAAAVEALLDLPHPLLLGVPVEQAGVVDEIRVLARASSPPARPRRPSGTRPPPSGRRGCERACSPAPAPAAGAGGARDRARRRRGRPRARGSSAARPRSRPRSARSAAARREARAAPRAPSRGRVTEAIRPPVDPRQVVGAAAGDRAGDLRHERTRERRRARTETCQPRLDVEAPVDHQLGKLSDRADLPRAAS